MQTSVMLASDYSALWLGAGSAASWVLHNLTPLLLAAGACRIVTLLFVPRRGL